MMWVFGACSFTSKVSICDFNVVPDRQKGGVPVEQGIKDGWLLSIINKFFE